MPSDAAAADHDLLAFLHEAPDSVAGPQRIEPWRVLVVDDDPDVHSATQIALDGITIESQPLFLLHAYSAAEAFDRIASDDGIAAVLLDVVMETQDAGLRLVQRIRTELGRSTLRIVLRTGQPGQAPEIETLRAYDINDYRAKSELTRVRLFSTLTTAIRSYRQLAAITRQRDEMAMLARSLRAAREAEREEAQRRFLAEEALRVAKENVEQCVAQRTQELSQAVAELEAFNRMVSHDLHGPLQGLAGLSGVMQEELDNGNLADMRRWLGLMENQTRHLAKLVRDLQDLARVAGGKLSRESVALEGVVAEALQTLALTSADRPLPPVTVDQMPVVAGDASLLRQVFVNLLGNAIKFAREIENPRIEVLAQPDGPNWSITVRDNGIGFEPGMADEIFKPFVRLQPSRFEGTGIGLTIAQRIVQHHGGSIWCEGTPGGGATFRFSLPAMVAGG